MVLCSQGPVQMSSEGSSTASPQMSPMWLRIQRAITGLLLPSIVCICLEALLVRTATFPNVHTCAHVAKISCTLGTIPCWVGYMSCLTSSSCLPLSPASAHALLIHTRHNNCCSHCCHQEYLSAHAYKAQQAHEKYETMPGSCHEQLSVLCYQCYATLHAGVGCMLGAMAAQQKVRKVAQRQQRTKLGALEKPKEVKTINTEDKQV